MFGNDYLAARTAAQIRMMSTPQLLQDPGRAAIYHRGWTDRTADVIWTLHFQPPRGPLHFQPTRGPQQQHPLRLLPRRQPTPTAEMVSGPSSGTSKKPPPEPRMSRAHRALVGNRTKFQGKTVEEPIMGSQLRRLSMHSLPTSELEGSFE